MTMRIRPADPDDAAGIAAAHLVAWAETYRGLLPENVLADMTLDRRTALWRQLLAPQGPSALITLVVEDDDGAIAGFGRAGTNRDAPASHRGEIQSIYLLGRMQRRGLGRALMTGLADHLARHDLFPALVWVLESNLPACRFYAALGGAPLDRRPLDLGGQSLAEVSYSWPSRSAFR